MKNKKILFGIVAVVAIIFTLTACGGSSALVGRWLPDEGQRIPSSFPERNMELLKDGKGLIDGYEFSWRTEGGRFYITNPLMAYAYNYKISGSKLTLTDDQGKSITYTKQK